MVIDEWSEDWSRLRHVIIQGEAQVLTSGADYRHGVELLLAKYEQYRRMGLDREDGVMIKVTPARVTHWSGAA
ncbi:MAG: hypothetical protein A2X53_06265 [Candidatus Rokubacteria bacterium GWA2_70_23]|nr:MAG: hypothetical protein A2X53_06265 [Candidatus Rokubacteria bacterium GWA2_70_23]